jgi:serine/threonine protein kinase
VYLLPGQRLGSYEIVALLGVGGMGQVYRARDPRLQREIALKILQTDDADHRKRFAREARAIAALNHPNIVTIHSVEEFEGQPFLTMELVEGTPLNRMIPPGGFEVHELLSIAIPIAEALAAAHARGIVHRDL